MIVKMKKVSLVVMDKEREAALEKLREIGVLHLERKSVSSDALTKLFERKAKTDTALGILRTYQTEAASVQGVDPEALVKEIVEVGERRKSLEDQLLTLAKERSRIEKWGDFEPSGLMFLAQHGVNIFLYEFSQKAFAALPEDTRFIVISQDKNTVYAAVFDKEVAGESPFALPELSLSAIAKETAAIRSELGEIEKRLSALAAKTGAVEAARKALLEQIEFETARAGMENTGDTPAESDVAWITGFVPQEDVGLLKRAAAEHSWALLADDPGPDDVVPTKLKNNPLVSLINPLTDFLEVTPGYNEVDISGWFLLFFTIFFGMIFGDAGYGALIFVTGIIGIAKTAKKGVPPVLKLLTLLGFSNLLWGTLTCSWFGMPLEIIPGALKNISLPLISNVQAAVSDYDSKIVQQNLMIVCFTLALLQLSIGHIIGIFRNRSLKSLADLGSIAMLFGMYCIILSLIASNEARRFVLSAPAGGLEANQVLITIPAVQIFAAGFALNFIFASYEGSVGKSILESLKNIISVILGIANVFSDIMSYIRLWAVGLAGAAIANTVNTMAGPMLGHLALFVFGILLLGFGHGLNIVLNVLSVLVHGVRLNTLEFSGHVGLTWAGSPYKPFAKRVV